MAHRSPATFPNWTPAFAGEVAFTEGSPETMGSLTHSVTPDSFRGPQFRSFTTIEGVGPWMPEQARHDEVSNFGTLSLTTHLR